MPGTSPTVESVTCAQGDAESGLVLHDPEEIAHSVVVVQRFAHAHEDDVAQAFAGPGEDARDMPDLRDHFPRGEMPAESALPGGAEHAALGAAGLRADAGGVPVALAHEHGLDGLTVREAQEVLSREAVGAERLAGNLRQRERVPAAQRVEFAVAGEVAGERVGEVAMDAFPVRQRLAGAEPVRAQPGGGFDAGQTGEVDGGGGKDGRNHGASGTAAGEW